MWHFFVFQYIIIWKLTWCNLNCFVISCKFSLALLLAKTSGSLPQMCSNICRLIGQCAIIMIMTWVKWPAVLPNKETRIYSFITSWPTNLQVSHVAYQVIKIIISITKTSALKMSTVYRMFTPNIRRTDCDSSNSCGDGVKFFHILFQALGEVFSIKFIVSNQLQRAGAPHLNDVFQLLSTRFQLRKYPIGIRRGHFSVIQSKPTTENSNFKMLTLNTEQILLVVQGN